MLRLLPVLALIGVTACATTATEEDDAGDGLVTVAAPEPSVEEAVDRIEAAIEEAGPMVVTVVDHAAAAQEADLELPPTTLIVFGAPPAGTPLMQAVRTVGIDLPQKVLVWEDEDGGVNITYNDPDYLAARHGIDGQAERLDMIRGVLEQIAGGA